MAGNGPGDGQGPVDLFARRRDFLYQTHAIGIFCRKFVGGEQIAHGIAPPDFPVQTKGCAAYRVNPAFDFDLAETGVAGGDTDVRGQHQLDADGQADALDSHHHGF